MEIILTVDDLAALSETARSEIVALLAEGKRQSDSAPGGPSEEGLAEVGFDLLSRFMNGVSSITRKFIETIAINEGKATPEQLLEATGYTEPIELRGIQSGITRRIRNLLGDDEVYLIFWRATSDEDWDGYFYVSPVTGQSLERYFSR